MEDTDDLGLDLDKLLEECDIEGEGEEDTQFNNEEDSDDFSDFDFSEFYQDDEDKSDKDVNSEELGIYYDESSYDEILDLHGDVSNISVEAKYPYIRVSGFLIKEEINFMNRILQEYMNEVNGSYSPDELIDIILNINGEDYIVGKVPLVLDTFLTIFRSHRYDVSLVRDEDSESIVTSELMKAFLFT